ncbi:DUF2577 domain-containing protein [Companilactobacillus allii]|uniref:DUF2577 domain-containing protein n=1 Tax=Companilactobacillus allii TaxID=1847728 RepID=A0A1P8Q4D2_9LACO|nr:DUF2577 domain-containing protein [Companilactobacillus allii]APX72720.1 hypothetical protein BTM29_09225 [Companilactobacillus allii]USQ67503.1 DUF2577 domain-containing protein [Companilactobacillus allii]
MAGEQLLELMNSKGGNESDYSDIVYGKVISIDPLKIQTSNQMILSESFLVLGRQVTKHKEHIRVLSHFDSIGEASGTRPDVSEAIEIDGSLQVDDEVTMIRFDGGQQFYVLERSKDRRDVDG